MNVSCFCSQSKFFLNEMLQKSASRKKLHLCKIEVITIKTIFIILYSIKENFKSFRIKMDNLFRTIGWVGFIQQVCKPLLLYDGLVHIGCGTRYMCAPRHRLLDKFFTRLCGKRSLLLRAMRCRVRGKNLIRKNLKFVNIM